MIFDALDRMAAFLPPQLTTALADISAASPEGKTVLVENRLWLSIFTVSPGAAEGKLWEAHRQFYDLQMVLEDEEFCLLDDEASCRADGAYNAADDCQLFRHDGPICSAIRLVPGKALLIGAGEVHAPGVIVPGFARPHRKLVAKIHADFFSGK